MSRPLRAVSCVALLVLAACGGGAGTLSGRTFRTRDTSYDLGALPETWRRLEVDDQNDLAFARSDGAVIQVNSSCDPALDLPLLALTNHLLIGFTERDVQAQELVALDAREALRTRVVAKLDGVARELVLVVLKKDGCVYDLALVAPPGPAFESALEAWEPFVAGFRARREDP